MLLRSESVKKATSDSNLDNIPDNDQGTEEVDIDGLICYHLTRGLDMRESVFFFQVPWRGNESQHTQAACQTT